MHNMCPLKQVWNTPHVFHWSDKEIPPQTHGVIVNVLHITVPFLTTTGAEITHFTFKTLKRLSHAKVITSHLQHQCLIPQQTL